MNKLPNPEEVIKGHLLNYPLDSEDARDINQWIKEYGRQVRNVTLEWAAQNAYAFYARFEDGYEIHEVKKESILDGKISKDLEI